jgi:hypothetical protein
MVLEYKFEYLSNNNTLESFIENILSKKDVDYTIIREEDLVLLYIEDKQNRLLAVSKELSKELPMSIFLKNYTLEVVPEIPQKEDIKTYTDINSSYCSNCLTNIENEESNNFYNPFFDCDICGTTYDVDNLTLLKKDIEKKYTKYKELFELLASKINENKKVKIKTKNGSFVYSKFDKIVEKNRKLICANINNISKLVVASKEEIVSLLSVEKPSLDLRVNEVFKMSNDVNCEKVNIKYSNDLIIYLLSKELEAFDIDFLVYEDSKDYDYELVYDYEGEEIKSPKIMINESKILILENENYDENLDTIYNKFSEKSKAQFMVLNKENTLEDKSILNIFCSTQYDDNICLYSPKIDGIIDILNYDIPSSICDIFDQIAEDETGKKLLENYKLKYKANYEKALEYEIQKDANKSIFTLWKIAAVILGFENSDNTENIIIHNASVALLEKGPRVDYKLFENDKIFNKEFNITKFIKSGMSFKLAGVDSNTLSLGYIESFSYFLANLVDEVHGEFILDGVSLCGDMISNELFYKLLHKAITKNFKIYYNKDFPIQK